MAKASTKHFNQRRIPLPAFPLGLDWSQNEENIPDGALAEAENCEYTKEVGALRTCQGVQILWEHGATITAGFWDTLHSVWLFTDSDNKLWKTTDFVEEIEVGTLSGSEHPAFAIFKDVVLIASGGILQYYDGTTFGDVTDSPNCKYVTERQFRVLVYGYDNSLYFSGINSYTDWIEDPADDSRAIVRPIPGATIIRAVDILADDVIVYTDTGAWRISGYYPSWAIKELGRDISAYDAVSVGTESFYIGESGFTALSTAIEYGDFRRLEAGLNINSALKENLDSTARVWHVKRNKQIWVKPQNSEEVYLYHYLPRYDDGRGAFTRRKFKYVLQDVVTKGNDVFVFYDKKIGRLTDVDTDDGMQIFTSIKSKKFLPQRLYTILKYTKFTCGVVRGGIGTLEIGDNVYPLNINSSKAKIYANKSMIYQNQAKIHGQDYFSMHEYGGGSNEQMQVSIYVLSGAIELKSLDLEVAEV